MVWVRLEVLDAAEIADLHGAYSAGKRRKSTRDLLRLNSSTLAPSLMPPLFTAAARLLRFKSMAAPAGFHQADWLQAIAPGLAGAPWLAGPDENPGRFCPPPPGTRR